MSSPALISASSLSASSSSSMPPWPNAKAKSLSELNARIGIIEKQNFAPPGSTKLIAKQQPLLWHEIHRAQALIPDDYHASAITLFSALKNQAERIAVLHAIKTICPGDRTRRG